MLFSFLLFSLAFTKEVKVGAIYGLDELDSALDKAMDRNTIAGIPPTKSGGMFVGENVNWRDTWGWCVWEDKRRKLPNQISRPACLVACDKETWNGKYGTGCEWSPSYKTCTVFFGDRVDNSNRGSNYRCNKGQPKWRNFKDNLDGRVGVYYNTCSPQDGARGCKTQTLGSGPNVYSTCTCSADNAFFECNGGVMANGVGPVTRDSYEGCVNRFKNTGKKFIYNPGSKHCQETEMDQIRESGGWMTCTHVKPYDSFESQNPLYKKAAAAMTMRRTESGSSTMEVLVNAFAAIGFAATFFGAFRFYTSK